MAREAISKQREEQAAEAKRDRRLEIEQYGLGRREAATLKAKKRHRGGLNDDNIFLTT